MYAVVGKPVVHSRSPEMFNAAFRARRMNSVYLRLASMNAADALRTAKEIGLRGLSVTAPYKERFIGLMDELDRKAEKVGAVNAVLIESKKAVGFNTDVYGVTQALTSHGVKLKEEKALVIGAGGAARAAVSALVDAGAEVMIANRTVSKALTTARAFGCEHVLLNDAVLKEAMEDIDVIVSCVSTAERLVPRALLRKEMVVLDANYSTRSALVKDAESKGCRMIDGRELLLFQGLKSFELFTGEKAPESVMRNAVCCERNTMTRREDTGGEQYGCRSVRQRKVGKRNISLIGFMGSGKTTVAGEISKHSGMRVVDVDMRIERGAGTPICEIFQREGETFFRKLEREEIGKLESVRDSVISCGGGAILDPRNVNVLREISMVVWLWANERTVVKKD